MNYSTEAMDSAPGPYLFDCRSGRFLDAPDGTTVGREGNRYDFPTELSLAPRHFAIRSAKGAFYAVGLDAASPLEVNGNEIPHGKAARLSDGDILRAGSLILLYSVSQSPPEEEDLEKLLEIPGVPPALAAGAEPEAAPDPVADPPQDAATEAPPAEDEPTRTLTGVSTDIPRYCPNGKCKYHAEYQRGFCTVLKKSAPGSRIDPGTVRKVFFRCRNCGLIFGIREWNKLKMVLAARRAQPSFGKKPGSKKRG